MAVQGRTDFTYYAFFLGGDTYRRDTETILQNAARVAVLKSLTLMGKVLVSVPTTGTADAGNTAGSGTLTGLALIAGTLPRAGTWTVECVTAVANGGVFKLVDPSGNIIRNDLTMTVGAAAATTFYIPEAGVKFVLTDATDFAEGDKFTFAVAKVGKYVPFDPAAVNGAQIPAGIFVGDDITTAALVAGDVTGQPIVVHGVACLYDDSLLVLENGANLDTTVLAGGKTLRESLYGLGFLAKSTFDVTKLEN